MSKNPKNGAYKVCPKCKGPSIYTGATECQICGTVLVLPGSYTETVEAKPATVEAKPATEKLTFSIGGPLMDARIVNENGEAREVLTTDKIELYIATRAPTSAEIGVVRGMVGEELLDVALGKLQKLGLLSAFMDIIS